MSGTLANESTQIYRIFGLFTSLLPASLLLFACDNNVTTVYPVNQDLERKIEAQASKSLALYKDENWRSLYQQLSAHDRAQREPEEFAAEMEEVFANQDVRSIEIRSITQEAGDVFAVDVLFEYYFDTEHLYDPAVESGAVSAEATLNYVLEDGQLVLLLQPE